MVPQKNYTLQNFKPKIHLAVLYLGLASNQNYIHQSPLIMSANINQSFFAIYMQASSSFFSSSNLVVEKGNWASPRRCILLHSKWQGNQSSLTILFSRSDSRNEEHSWVKGGRLCDEPLKMFSQGLSLGPVSVDDVSFRFWSSLLSSP